jgi:hypothetical protein
MRRALGAAVALLILAASSRPSGAEVPIGFGVVERADTARRSAAHPNGRPIQISLWYPANPAAGAPRMTFSDYVRLTTPLEGYRGFLAGAGVPPAEADAWLATGMRAFRDAPRTSRRFPLVLIAQGNGDSTVDQAFLAEQLAAHGFVVASTAERAPKL